MSPVARNQIQEKHWFQFEEPMNNQTNEPSCKPTCEPTKRMDFDAELPSNQSSKRVMHCNASTQGPEGASNETEQLRHKNQKKRGSFFDEPEPVEIEISPPQATNTNSQNMWHMPQSVNLDTSGLRHSSRTEVLNSGQVYSNTAMLSNTPLQSASK